MAMNYKMNPDMIRCQGCSEAGGADRDIYHLPPECKSTSPETTLTCSEVVERLATCIKFRGLGHFSFNREEAEKILDSWRERRVQELEKCLRWSTETLRGCLPLIQGNGYRDSSDKIKEGLKVCENTLANSEQIRKGAKHDPSS